jgi:hypothetical protein
VSGVVVVGAFVLSRGCYCTLLLLLVLKNTKNWQTPLLHQVLQLQLLRLASQRPTYKVLVQINAKSGCLKRLMAQQLSGSIIHRITRFTVSAYSFTIFLCISVVSRPLKLTFQALGMNRATNWRCVSFFATTNTLVTKSRILLDWNMPAAMWSLEAATFAVGNIQYVHRPAFEQS